MLNVLLAICLFGNTLASVVEPGGCPNVKTKENFEMTKYLGEWHIQEIYDMRPHAASKCQKITFTRDENGTVHALKDQIRRDSGTRIQMPGTLEENNSTDSGKLHLFIYGLKTSTSTYWILETDYVSYSIVYVCQNVHGNRHQTTSLIITRDKNPSKTLVATYFEVIEKFNLKRNYFRKIQHDDCSLRPSL